MSTIAEQALSEFTLANDVGSEEGKTACAASLLALIHARKLGIPVEWTAQPKCAHPSITANVIAANDAPGVTQDQKAALVVPRRW
jgi:hypothetical protein